MALAGFDDHSDQPKYRRMQGVVQIGDALVDAVDGQGLLDEVVGADGQEIEVPGKVTRG